MLLYMGMRTVITMNEFLFYEKMMYIPQVNQKTNNNTLQIFSVLLRTLAFFLIVQ